MSKNIELQEEFEALIGELERLKSINEITSSNSENAKNTINEIKSFVHSVNTFKTSIESDYHSKKKDLEKMEESMKDSVTLLNEGVNNQSKKFKSLTNDYLDKSNKTLESIKDRLDKKVHDYTAEVKNLRSKLEKDILDYGNDVDKKIGDQNNSINEKIEDLTNKFIDQLTSINKDMFENKEELKTYFLDVKKGIEVTNKELKRLTTIFIITVAVFFAILFGLLLYKFI